MFISLYDTLQSLLVRDADTKEKEQIQGDRRKRGKEGRKKGGEKMRWERRGEDKERGVKSKKRGN